MNAEPMASIAGWLITFALHGTAFALVAWAIDRSLAARHIAWRELIWRFALFGAAISASVQCFDGSTPLGGHWRLASLARNSAGITVAARAPLAAPGLAAIATARAGTASNRMQTARARIPEFAQPKSRPEAYAATRLPVVYWPAWIVGVWLGGALLAVLRLGCRLATLRAMLRSAEALETAAGTRGLAALCGPDTTPAPRLYVLHGIASAMAVTGKRVIFPSWALASLDRDSLRAMLAHEAAHLMRHDPHWKLLIAGWRAVFWFLPLAGLAQRRLDALAELSCDAVAARRVGNARSVAECLAACAEHCASASSHALAPAMAARESSLMHRIDRLLEGVPMQIVPANLSTRAIVLTLLIVSGVSLPVISFVDARAAMARGSASSSVSIHSDNGKQNMWISVSDDLHSLKANVDGKIAFNADDTGVASLSVNGSATFEETQAGATRRAEFAERDGKLERRYFINGTEHPFDADAQAWFARLLPALIREAGIDAEARVKRIYAASGADGVLDEIERIHSGYARGVYLKLLT
ncbi:MAG: M56 family metallopeptidase, partial [Rudaea sp.]